MAETNVTTTGNINVTPREIDFVTQFGRNWDSLREILGVMRPIKKEAGTQLVSYETTVTLSSDEVGEGEVIPYSKAETKEVKHEDLKLGKYSKGVTAEAIAKYGAKVAIEMSDEEFKNELQAKVMTDFYEFLQTGTLTDTQKTLQKAIAMAKGKVVDKFKKLHKDVSNVVVFINTLDLYEYLGDTPVTLQTLNGIEYIKNFLGAQTIIVTSDIPQGKVFATPVNNLVLYYIDPSKDFQEAGLTYAVQGETNLIGFHVQGNYNTAVGEAFAMMGMKLWAEYLDGISNVTISAGE